MNNQFNSDEEVLARLVREAGDPSIAPDPQYAQKLRATILDRVGPAETVAHLADTTHPTFLTRSLTTWRWIMHSPISRAAAAAIFVLAVTAVALWFHGGGATPTFADFITPILDAKGVKFKITVVMKGPPAVTLKSNVMMLDDALMRHETQIPFQSKTVVIQDFSQGKSLNLNIATKTATLLTFTNRPNKYEASGDKAPLAGYRSLLLDARDKPGVKREPLGEKEIDGRRVIGFRVRTDGRDMDLWGDPETGLPVRIEITSGMDGNLQATMSDFVFNADLDESLFSLDPPTGYTIENQTMDGSPQEEKDLIEAFREYTKLTGGVLPDSLDSRKVTFAFWKKLNFQNMWNNLAPGLEPDEEFEKQMSKIMDEMMNKTMAGKMCDEEQQKLVEQMQKITMKITGPLVIQKLWENLALAKWKPNEEQRHNFWEQISKVMEGEPGEEQTRKLDEVSRKIMLQMLWEDLAPAKWKTNVERKQQFDKQMNKKIAANLNEEQKQKIDVEIAKTLGDQLLKDVKAWEARMSKVAQARVANMQESAKVQADKSRKFMEAQQRVQRGLTFANQLPPQADAHYAGKGVSLGAADRPIFWYRPQDAKKYRVIYADLSVREDDTPPSVPDTQPVPAPSSPKK